MPSAPTREGAGIPHLADRLNVLFAEIPRPEKSRPYSNARAAADLDKLGISITGVYLSQMRAGIRTNPNARLLAGLATLFQVPIGYFFDDDLAEQVTSRFESLIATRDARVHDIMLGSADLSDRGLAAVAAIVVEIRRYEGLEDHNVARRAAMTPFPRPAHKQRPHL